MRKAVPLSFMDTAAKKTIRRALLKAVAIPGHQIPFSCREIPLPYGWGTGAVQITASLLGKDDTLKVIDQGADDTELAMTIKDFFKKTTAVVTTETTPRATIIQTRHRIPETPLSRDQIVVYQVAGSDPLRVIEPGKSRAARMHALQAYDDLYLKLYEDIAVHHRSPGTFDHPVLVNDRYMMSPSPIPRFDNPKLHNSPALHLFGAGREKRIYAVPPFTRVRSLAFEDFPPVRESRPQGCHRCGSTTSFLNTSIMDAGGTRRWICSDTEYCRNNMRNKTS